MVFNLRFCSGLSEYTYTEFEVYYEFKKQLFLIIVLFIIIIIIFFEYNFIHNHAGFLDYENFQSRVQFFDRRPITFQILHLWDLLKSVLKHILIYLLRRLAYLYIFFWSGL